MISTLAIYNYRSLRDFVMPLSALNVITGANGSGKSNVYRALRLLADIAQGRIIPSLAREGGLQSTLWAGPEGFARSVKSGEHPVQGTLRKEPVSLRLGFSGDEFGYAMDLGLPTTSSPSFSLDPEIKRECIWAGEVLRPAALLVERRGPLVRSRADKEWIQLTQGLAGFDSMMTHCADPRSSPEMLMLREQMRGWRFYDQFRADLEAPARQPQIGTHTPVLANDGADLAAALQTSVEIGDAQALADSVGDAFPGASVSVSHHDGRFEVEMRQHGLLRPLKAAELSDGTLRYLLWIAALLTPRPPQLLVLNEPETSLHPELLPALGRLIGRAAEHSQIIVVSHAARLIAALEELPGCNSVTLEKNLGETGIAGADRLDRPRWQWPSR
ncbi:MAG TPA: AAA family ATPase [Burkholderiales bacterium]|jgi:predicted ATPase|nr:AAA family ATPase [Burkholderiales bacterium]